jgi:hypothetical protein
MSSKEFPDLPGGEHAVAAVVQREGPDRIAADLVDAFSAIGVDAVRENQPLTRQIDAEAITALSGAATPWRLSVVLWGHPVVITAEDITVYERT